jgi:CheY-like chemotaxis protein
MSGVVGMSEVPVRPVIMVIDDDSAIRSAISELLDDAGYQVIEAADGREGLTHLSKGVLPHLIVLDLMMPVADGWKFRAEQMMNPALASIPVIVITAIPVAAPHQDLGVEVLSKPFKPEVLLSMVRRHCAPGVTAA